MGKIIPEPGAGASGRARGGAQGEPEREEKEEKKEMKNIKSGFVWVSPSALYLVGSGSGLCEPLVPPESEAGHEGFSFWLGIWDAATPLDRGLGRGDPRNPKEGPGKGLESGHS